MPILLRGDLIVQLAFLLKYGIITVLRFSKYASPIFAKRKPNGKLRLPVDIRKINSLIADDHTKNNHPVSTLSDSAQHLTGKSLFCKLDCSKLVIVCRWRTNGQWKCLHSSSPTEPVPAKDLQEVLVDRCLLFQVSCVSTWTQSLKMSSELSTWTTLESQPLTLRISPRTIGQSSSTFVKQDSNWQLRNATSESDKLSYLEEQTHQQESHHKPGKFKIS